MHPIDKSIISLEREVSVKFHIIGSIMKRSKKLHISSLGHYLQGTGELLDLSDKMNFDNIMTISKNNIHDEYGIAEIYHKSLTKKDSKDPYYNTWGKAVIVSKDNDGRFSHYNDSDITAIMDTYQFYPWCGVSTHFKNCGCPRQTWGTTEVRTNIKSNIFNAKRRTEIARLVIETDNQNRGWITVLVKQKDCSSSQWKYTKRIRLKLLDNKINSHATIIRIKYAKRGRDKIFTLVISDYIWSLFGKPFHYYAIRR